MSAITERLGKDVYSTGIWTIGHHEKMSIYYI